MMLLHAAMRSAIHSANSGGHSTVIRNLDAPGREIRFTFPRPPPRGITAGALVVEERWYNEEFCVWSDWRPFDGFTVEDVHVWHGPPGEYPRWEVREGCGVPCGSVKNVLGIASPGNQGCQNSTK